ncbi:MAG: ferric reductase-like transmembrane domain-containing protein [Proteobacteria bacterium]|nr:ferric reductase-like transmembrane domain-containing protein [Pseudomonadota bacterium]
MNDVNAVGSKAGKFFGWKGRHLVALLLAGFGAYILLESRAEWSPMHRWNRALGDAGLILISFSMAIGPLVRLWPRFRGLIPFRREFGIHGVLLSVAHTMIILGGWVEWDLVRVFGYEVHPQTGKYIMLQHGFALANVIGIVALVYGIVLTLTSSNWSQRFLGGTAWKFLQQGSYVLWMLTVLHTAYFLYLHFQDFHRPTPQPNWAQLPFAGLVAAVALLQLLAFLRTWKKKRVETIDTVHQT